MAIPVSYKTIHVAHFISHMQVDIPYGQRCVVQIDTYGRSCSLQDDIHTANPVPWKSTSIRPTLCGTNRHTRPILFPASRHSYGQSCSLQVDIHTASPVPCKSTSIRPILFHASRREMHTAKFYRFCTQALLDRYLMRWCQRSGLGHRSPIDQRGLSRD